MCVFLSYSGSNVCAVQGNISAKTNQGKSVPGEKPDRMIQRDLLFSLILQKTNNSAFQCYLIPLRMQVQIVIGNVLLVNNSSDCGGFRA